MGKISIAFIILLFSISMSVCGNTMERDSQLQSVLDTKGLKYLLFLLEESTRTGTIFEENDEREIDMGLRVDKIIQLYLKEGDKAVIHAHTSHTNKSTWGSRPPT